MNCSGHLGQLGQLAKPLGHHLTHLRLRLGWAVRMLRRGRGLKDSPALIRQARLRTCLYGGGRGLSKMPTSSSTKVGLPRPLGWAGPRWICSGAIPKRPSRESLSKDCCGF